MTVIDLNKNKYQSEVVVKCGKHTYTAIPSDETLQKITQMGKVQMKNGLKVSKDLENINFDKIKANEIDNVVDTTVNTLNFAKKDYIKLADIIFGSGAGENIYNYLNHSTLALKSVLEEVITQLYKRYNNDSKQTLDKYLKS